MSRSLESSGHDQETRSEPADLPDLRKQVYPKFFARRRDPKVFPAILRVRERPLWIRIALFCLVRGKRRLQPLPARLVAPAFACAVGHWAKAGAFAYEGCVGDPWRGVTCNAQGRKRLFSKDFDEDDDQHEDEMGGLAKYTELVLVPPANSL